MHIKNSRLASTYLRRVIGFEQEEFWVLCLTSKLQLISAKLMFLGTVDKCLIHPRDIFRYAMQENASKIMIAHSHPHGGPEPSGEDIRVTDRLIEVGYLVGIPVVDHIILSKRGYVSCLDKKVVNFFSESSYRRAERFKPFSFQS
ncbi:MAG: JAB domain-containing protein [Bdellovibrionales bacterium]|nr:JAB domain-containing protein [Bdellovibrionales bacterium]